MNISAVRWKSLSLTLAGAVVLVAFQNCAPPSIQNQQTTTGPQPLRAIEMTKSSSSDEVQSFESLHQLVVVEKEMLELKTACGPNREARIRNLDSDKSILEAEGEISIRIDNIRVKQDEYLHVMGCPSQAMDETDELLSQITRVEKAQRIGSRIHFTTAEGLILVFEFQQ